MLPTRRYHHCASCGSPVQYRVPTDDNRERAVCTACGQVHYENPTNVVGTLPVAPDGRILLCRRAIEPQRGLWTLPAGFMELGESVSEGALRETQEEAGAEVALEGLLSVISVPRIGQVHLFFRARLLSLEFAPGPESLEVALFDWQDLPWSELAFRTVHRTLEYQRAGANGLLMTTL